MTDTTLLILLLLAGYSYFLYPAILAGITLLRRASPRQERPGAAPDFCPPISLIVTAFNEESRIAAKLEECLLIDYPKGLLEIIIASDASTDATDSIVAGYAAQGVRLARAHERLGKEHAQSVAIAQARGEIIVFSDVGTTLRPDAIRQIVAPFRDNLIGAVSSEDTFLSRDGRIVGEGLYVRYEMWLRRLESEVFSLVGLSGSFFAARRSVCERWDSSVPSDFNTALSVVSMGMRAVSSPDARGIYSDVKDAAAEYARKVRTVQRGIAALMKRRDILLPRSGTLLFCWQMWSHKVARWMTPWILVMLMAVSTAALSDQTSVLAGLFVAGQLAFYGGAVLGAASTAARSLAPIRIAYYFSQANVAILHATLNYLSGSRVTVWNPTRR